MNAHTPTERGSIALMMVLMVLAMISAIAVEIAYQAQVSAKVVVNRRDDAKAYELAKAAYRWSLLRLQIDTQLDQIPAIPSTNYGGKKDDLLEMQWAFPISYPFPDLAPEKEKQKIESTFDGTFLSVMSDESAKINLNDVGSGGNQNTRQWSGASEVLENLLLSHRFKKYMQGRDHRELLWAIDDWTDNDSQVNHVGGGIEDAEYQIELDNFHVKNQPLFSVAEARFLKPMNEELYRELLPFVTVYPFDASLPRLSSQPVQARGKININTAPMEIIAALFDRRAMPDLRARLDCAKLVVDYRKAVVFRSIRGAEPSLMGILQTQCGASRGGNDDRAPILSQAVSGILDVRSDLFAVEATGSVASSEKTIYAVVSRQDPKQMKTYYWRVK